MNLKLLSEEFNLVDGLSSPIILFIIRNLVKYYFLTKFASTLIGFPKKTLSNNVDLSFPVASVSEENINSEFVSYIVYFYMKKILGFCFGVWK